MGVLLLRESESATAQEPPYFAVDRASNKLRFRCAENDVPKWLDYIDRRLAHANAAYLEHVVQPKRKYQQTEAETKAERIRKSKERFKDL